jgi:hypothetical protein
MVKAAFGGIVDVICTFDPHKLYNHSGTKFQFLDGNWKNVQFDPPNVHFPTQISG